MEQFKDLREAEYKPVRSPALRKMLDEAGYEKYNLVKGDFYYYVTSEDPECADRLSRLTDTKILAHQWKELSIEEWFTEIEGVIKRATKAEELDLRNVKEFFWDKEGEYLPGDYTGSMARYF